MSGGSGPPACRSQNSGPPYASGSTVWEPDCCLALHTKIIILKSFHQRWRGEVGVDRVCFKLTRVVSDDQGWIINAFSWIEGETAVQRGK